MQLQTSNFKADSLETASSTQILEQWLINQLSEQLSLDSSAIEVSEPLTRYGLDSIDAVTLVGDLEDSLDLELPDTLFWDYPSIEKAASFLAENYDLDQAVTNLDVTATPAPKIEAPKDNKKGGWGLFGRSKG